MTCHHLRWSSVLLGIFDKSVDGISSGDPARDGTSFQGSTRNAKPPSIMETSTIATKYNAWSVAAMSSPPLVGAHAVCGDCKHERVRRLGPVAGSRGLDRRIRKRPNEAICQNGSRSRESGGARIARTKPIRRRRAPKPRERSHRRPFGAALIPREPTKAEYSPCSSRDPPRSTRHPPRDWRDSGCAGYSEGNESSDLP